MKRFLDLHEIEELRNEANMNSKIAKNKLKRLHYQIILRKEFQGQKVLLNDSKLHIFPKKLKSRWNDPYLVYKVHSKEVIESVNSKGGNVFKINGHDLSLTLSLWCKRMRNSSYLILP